MRPWPSCDLPDPARRAEALELLLGDVRNGTRSDLEATACQEKMAQVKMRLVGDRVSPCTAWQIARERGWEPLRAAEYLAVPILQADAFATVDRDMVGKAENPVRVVSGRQLESAG